MTIEAQLPDGTTLQFPDGTPDAVVQGAVKQHMSQQPSGAAQTPESKLGLTPAPPEDKPPPPTYRAAYRHRPGCRCAAAGDRRAKRIASAQPVASTDTVPSTM